MDEASHTVLAHERLAIVDLENGAQPLTNETDTVWLSVNGEIYNRAPLNPLVHTTLTSAPDRYLRQDLRKKYKFKTNSDCEPIIYLVRLPLALMHCRLTPPSQYEEFGTNFLNRLSGDFVFVLYDVTKKRFMAARDPMGVCPLYVGYGKDGSTWFASEMKVRSLLSAFYIDLSPSTSITCTVHRFAVHLTALQSLQDDCDSWEVFPPGHFYTSDMPRGQYQRYYDPPWWNPDHIPAGKADHMLVRSTSCLWDRALAHSMFLRARSASRLRPR